MNFQLAINKFSEISGIKPTRFHWRVGAVSVATKQSRTLDLNFRVRRNSNFNLVERLFVINHATHRLCQAVSRDHIWW